MATITKGAHRIEVERHPQPFGVWLYEAVAPDGFKWAGDTWSIHGESLADLRQRVAHTNLEPAEEDEDL